MSPRVIDQRAFDELAKSLRGLIESADASSQQLTTLLSLASQDDGRASQSSLYLQERLRLSARMLKAFQAQIGRAEGAMTALAEQEARVSGHMQALDVRVQEAGQSVDSAMLKLEATEKDRQARLQEKLDRQHAELEQRMMGAISGMEARYQQRLAEAVRGAEAAAASVHERTEEALGRLGSAVDEAVRRGAARVEEHAAAREVELTRLNTNVAEALPKANAILAVVENAQSRVNVLTQQVSEAGIQLQAARQDTLATMAQCADARAGLNHDLVEAESRIDITSARAQELRTSVQGLAGSAAQVETDLRQRLAEVQSAVRQIEKAESTAQRLAGLLNHLAPWEKVILRRTGEHTAMPEPLAQLVDDARHIVRDEMLRLSTSMRTLADRVEQAARQDRPAGDRAVIDPAAQAARAIIDDLTSPTGSQQRPVSITEYISSTLRDGSFVPTV